MMAVRAERSSSTISTVGDDSAACGWVGGACVGDGDFEATSVRSGVGKSDVASDVTRQRSTDGKAHPESFAPVSFIIVHLVELVEEVRHVLRRHSNAAA